MTQEGMVRWCLQSLYQDLYKTDGLKMTSYKSCNYQSVSNNYFATGSCQAGFYELP